MAVNIYIGKNVISPLGAILHSLLLIAMFKDPLKCFRNTGTYLVANLAVSDFLVCTLATLESIISVNDCVWFQIDQFLLRLFPSVSFASIVSISIDRFIMVAYPFTHRGWMKRKIMSVWIICIWFISLLYPGKRVVFGREKHDRFFANYFALGVVLLTAILYAITYFKLRKKSRNIVLRDLSDTSNRSHSLWLLKEKRFLTTIIVIAGITVLCTVPLLVMSQAVIIPGLLGNSLAVDILHAVLFSLYYSSFTVNPIIYIMRLPIYRHTFYLTYCKGIISCCSADNGRDESS